jgi:hypothetical protein
MPPLMDVSIRESIEEDVAAFTEAGARHGCPFCIGRTAGEVKSGDKVVFLKGSCAGRTANVVKTEAPRSELFYVKFLKVTNGTTRICSYQRDEFLRYPLPKVPEWICPLSIEDLCSIENSILDLLLRPSAEKTIASVLPLAKSLSSTAWHRRLPVSGSEVFETLRNHGFHDEWQHEFIVLFDFAIDLLTSNHGRPAIMRKRVSPMSIGRYLSKSSRALWVQTFRYDPTISPFSV